MKLESLLKKKRDTIVKEWFNSLAATYHLDTSGFLKSGKDRFANPVGVTMRDGLALLFDELLKGMDRERIIPHIEPIIKIRAVQDFSPSQAISFVFSLKEILESIVGKKLENSKAEKDMARFFVRIDSLALLAFDIFMGCRERLYDIKANQEKTKVFKAFKRAGLITEIRDDEPGLNDSNNI